MSSNSKVSKTALDLQFIKSAFEKDNDLSYKVFNEMPIGICITNEQGFFTDVNQAYCDIYKYSSDELIGKEFTMVVPKAERPVLEKLHEDFLSKKFELRGKWTVQDKYGKKFDIVTNAAYMDGEVDKKPRKMTLVVRAKDIDDTLNKLRLTIEILESKITAQDNAKELAEHDMRNNLGAIVSIASILENSKPTEDQLKWLKMIKNIGNDTLELLEASNGYAKMEGGNYKPKMQNFDLFEVIKFQMQEIIENNVDKEISPQYFLDGRELEKEGQQLELNADRFYIKRLFKNLLNNAAEASPKKATVNISVNTDKSLLIEVTNQGLIPDTMRDNFFEKYTTAGKDKGTGLGTYIAKLITETHGGSISFKTNDEVGTTIYINFPKDMMVTD
ncbi:PAS domain-containing sensor histidine kinase [Flavimarina sp. Hel_I_48]|uniref:sensor histidine kinase n=1 Tax=Flavimarina sp. Hel_I_48 TaxID=1392488 RepID=UPI00068D1CA1|nr:PAS domain-containing sensor histidine kinase [Flavimarina sp. Hel_I_48]